MKKLFGIYSCGFKKQDGEIKPGITFVNGEVDMLSKEYESLTVEEACRKRLSKEYDGKNSAATHLSFNLDWDTFIFREIVVDWDENSKGVDKQLHKHYVKCGIKQLLDSETREITEEFDFGPDYVRIIDEAIAYCFGPMKEESYTLRPVQKACIDKMMAAYQNFKNNLV